MSKPEELFLAAESIAAIAKDEPLIRASISRYYYSAFHRGSEYNKKLPLIGTVGRANGKHEQLIAMLGNPDPKLDEDTKDQSVAVSKLLRVLCNKRVDSDYHMHVRQGFDDLAEVKVNIDLLFDETK
ncbi:MAG: hypothetical protein K2X55_28480 [Burkholderiaceae bacterium]|nr:hypothetical protein [Burkholderiaceae bacterium]